MELVRANAMVRRMTVSVSPNKALSLDFLVF